MYCNKCGTLLPDEAAFCQNCGASVRAGGTASPFTPPVAAGDNSKAFCIISYISILWLFGLLASPEKNNPRVRFHVGQGIVASIAAVACQLAASLISSIMSFAFPVMTALLLSPLLHLAAVAIFVFYLVYGVVHTSRGEDKLLPIIGRYAFYK